MRIAYLKGRKSRHTFMAFGKVVTSEHAKNIPVDKLKYYEDETLRFYKRYNSLKTILRRIRKQNYPKGTVITVFNWYAGYADVQIFI